MTKYIFLDTETTGLHRRTRQIWDLAYIVRSGGHDFERQFWMHVDLSSADPFALKIGGYYKRHPDPFARLRFSDSSLHGLLGPAQVARTVAEDFFGAVIVGAVPSFDEESLANLLLDNECAPTWNHHLIDVETLAAGALGLEFPWNLDTVLAALGLTYPEEARHTAIGDARMVRDVYDAIQGRWHGQPNDALQAPAYRDYRAYRATPEEPLPAGGPAQGYEQAESPGLPCVMHPECDGTESCRTLCHPET